MPELSSRDLTGQFSARAAWRRALIPLGLVIVSLVSLAVIPPLMLRKTELLRRQFATLQAPAHLQLARISRGLALQSATARAYVALGDERDRADYLAARAATDAAIWQLRGQADEIGVDIRAGTDTLLAHLVSPYAALDSLFGGTMTRADYVRDLYVQRQRLDRAYDDVESLTRILEREREATRTQLNAAVRHSRIVEVLLILLGSASALLVARLAKQYSELAARLSRFAATRLRFIALAQRLNAAATLDDVRAVLNEQSGAMAELKANANTEDREALQLLREITNASRKRAALGDSLRDSMELFRQTADGLNVGVWLRTVDRTRFLFANTAMERLIAVPREALYADPAALFRNVHPDDVAPLKATPGRGEFEIEFRVVDPAGGTRWLWSRAFPIRNEKGEAYRVAGITEDITERKLAAETRTRLIRGFTHDVKNPLGAAEGQLALLDEGVAGVLDEKQKHVVDRARHSIRSALQLTNDLLDIARAEAGQLEVHRRPVAVDRLVRDVTDEFRGQVDSHDLTLSLEASKDAPLIVDTDKDRVRQILANLLSNAIKYTSRGGKVSVRAEKHSENGAGEWVTVAVQDTGIGISSEEQARLFKEFSRFKSGVAEGAGIGLAISQRLAEALKGKITLRSKERVGSTFTLWLPVHW